MYQKFEQKYFENLWRFGKWRKNENSKKSKRNQIFGKFKNIKIARENSNENTYWIAYNAVFRELKGNKRVRGAGGTVGELSYCAYLHYGSITAWRYRSNDWSVDVHMYLHHYWQAVMLSINLMMLRACGP